MYPTLHRSLFASDLVKVPSQEYIGPLSINIMANWQKSGRMFSISVDLGRNHDDVLVSLMQ